MMRLESLAHEHSDNPEKQAILRALYQYAEKPLTGVLERLKLVDEKNSQAENKSMSSNR